jgi:hypothetical protein
VRIEFTLTDSDGKKYAGMTELVPNFVANSTELNAIDEKAVPQSSQPKGLPEHILSLRSQGFFKEPRTPSDVHERLQTDYHCEFERVKVALLRLQKRRELRKATKNIEGHERVAYVW